MQSLFQLFRMKVKHNDRKYPNKSAETFQYPHPLLKTMTEVEETKDYHPRSYQPFISHHSHFPSSKFIRNSNHEPSMNSEFGIILQPFNNANVSIVTLQKSEHCRKCFTEISSHSKIINSCEFICAVCRMQNDSNLSNHEFQQNNAVYDIRLQDNKTQIRNQKKICIVIQASEFNYQNKVAEAILNCVYQINSDQILFGFAFFDNKSVFFIDQDSNCIVKMNCLKTNNYEFDFNDLPISHFSFFKRKDELSNELQYIIAAIMYQESFLIKNTIVNKAVDLFSEIFGESSIQIKFFITTLSYSSQFQEKQKLALKDTSNLFVKFKQKILPKKSDHKTKLRVSANMVFFVFLENTNYKECIQKLGCHISKIYQSGNAQKISKELYYDLFQNISENNYFNTELEIKTGPNLQIASVNHAIYDNSKSFSIQKKENYQNTSVKIVKLNQNSIIPIVFKVSDKYTQNSNQNALNIHFTLKYIQNNQPKKRIISYQLRDIKPQNCPSFNYIDDEAYFYFLIKSIIDKHQLPVNSNQFKLALLQKLKILAEKLMVNYESSEINFPLTLTHTFLYSVLIQRSAAFNPLGFQFQYERYRFLTQNIELMSKKIYFRVYVLSSSGQIKNIKFCSQKLKNNGIALFENGRKLFLVIGNECTRQMIRNIFGIFDEITNLRKHCYELPIIPSNEAIRNLIDHIRSLHHSCYLPLEIMELFSNQFDDEIGRYFYKKEEHKAFLRKVWMR